MWSAVIGYCSNSPSRCHLARDLTLLTVAGSHCPECSASLIPAIDKAQQPRRITFEQQVLQAALVVVLAFVLFIIYLAY